MTSDRRFHRLPRIRGTPDDQARSDVDAELEFHLEMLVAELEAAGHGAEDARVEAMRQFGDVEKARAELVSEARETERRSRRLEWFDTLWQDVRFTIQTLVRSRGFALAAIITLALGIGVNSAMFGIMHAVLLRPLPFDEPERLVMAWENNTVEGNERYNVSPANYTDWRDGATAFAGLAAVFRYRSYTLTSHGAAERLAAATTGGDLFGVLGVQAALGRTLTPDDERDDASRVVVLMDGLWRRRFGADPAIIGQTLTLAGAPYTVVGVLPQDFIVPGHVDAEIVLPLRLGADQWQLRAVHFLELIGRLRRDATVAQAHAQLSTIAARLEREYPESNRGTRVTLLPLRDALVGEFRPALLVLFGAVGCVLLAACANIANLLLARMSSRSREIAVRTALGASRGRIARQVLTESTVLAVIGGAAGLVLATWLIRLARSLAPAELTQLTGATNPGAMYAFTFVLALITGALAGLLPALRAAGARTAGVLQESGRSAAQRRREHARRSLVVAQISLSFVLLVAAGLLLRSFQRLRSVDPGFNAEHVLTFNLDASGEPLEVIRFYDDVLERIAALPGVVAVGGINQLPMTDPGPTSWLTLEGHTWDTPTPPETGFRPVTPDYFAAMGIPLRAGRWLERPDRNDATLPALVNETFVRRFSPDRDPVGRRIRLGPNPQASWRTIVGVVGDTRNVGLAEPVTPDVYVIHAQVAASYMMLAVRTESDPLALAATVRRTVAERDPTVAMEGVTTLEHVVAGSMADRRFSLVLLGGFSMLALLLALVGTYGVLSYMVAQRTSEIGVRMALGAQHRDVMRLVAGECIALGLAGIALGGAAAIALTRVLRGMLYEVSATDPTTFVIAAGALAAATLAASWLPARRAIRLDPTDALRSD